MSSGFAAAAAGFGTGISLIAAIGAQNAFVLRQGLQREHVPVIVAICMASDAVLIVLGISGIGIVLRTWPAAVRAVALLGAVFLVGYGLLAARRALHPDRLEPKNRATTSPRLAALNCLALTWLNPHVYLDTVLLLGSVGNGYGTARWAFGAGAAGASALWFSGLGFGARLLAPVFARPVAWRVLDLLVAATMLTLGIRMAVTV